MHGSPLACADIYCYGFWNSGNVSNLELSAILLAAVILESKLHLLPRLRPPLVPGQIIRIGIKNLIRKGTILPLQLAYFVFSVFFSMSFVIVDFWLTKFNENLILLRAFNVGEFIAAKGIGHWLVWFVLLVVFLRYGWADVIHGAFSVGLLVALHEGLWYVAYSLAYTDQAAVTLYYYSPFFILFGALALGYFKMSDVIPHDRIKRTILIGLAVYAVWLLMGLPVSVNNITGPTDLYYNLFVNGIEDNSWIIMGVSLCV